MLTSAQVSEFERHGLLRVPQAVPATTAQAMRESLWTFLSLVHGRRRDDPSTWKPIDGRTRFKTLMRTGAFDQLGELLAKPVTDLLGLGVWNSPAHWGHPLVTFPNSGGRWAIPATGWHVDAHQWSIGPVPGLVAFTFLDQVLPRGGGTLVMPGSHHLTWQLCQQAGGYMRTAEMKTVLAGRHGWFADLWREPITGPDRLHRFLEEGAVVEGTHVHIAELCGQPGDVVLMNRRVLHATAPNARTAPRLMLADFLA